MRIIMSPDIVREEYTKFTRKIDSDDWWLDETQSFLNFRLTPDLAEPEGKTHERNFAIPEGMAVGIQERVGRAIYIEFAGFLEKQQTSQADRNDGCVGEYKLTDSDCWLVGVHTAKQALQVISARSS